MTLEVGYRQQRMQAMQDTSLWLSKLATYLQQGWQSVFTVWSRVLARATFLYQTASRKFLALCCSWLQ